VTVRPFPAVPVAALGLLALLASACATTQNRPAGPPPKTVTRGAEILVLAGGRSHFFENRRPHCLAYVLDGEWEFAAQQAALRTADRRRLVGVVLQSAEVLPGSPGSDLVTRAITQIIADTEREWGVPLQARVEAFPTLRPGAVVLEFESVTWPAVGQTTRLPLRVVAPFGAGLVMVVTALELADARAIATTLEVTEDPQCWRQTIRQRFPGVLQ
jgi:hypothetical protein